MGKVKTGIACSVEGCTEVAARSFAADKVTEAFRKASISLKAGRTRRAYLCDKHYKVFKKQQRTDRKVEKWRYSA
jgi:hypothetical protein